MTVLHLIVVAIVQGITEFLPISSSAHLILVPALTEWPDQGPLIDVAVHVGTLGAVLVYFRSDVAAVIKALYAAVRPGGSGRDPVAERLAAHIVVATVPVVIAGFVISTLGWQQHLRSVEVIGWATLIFGIVLYVADRKSPDSGKIEDLTWGPVVIIGLAQMLALLPGTSRSGITMTAARMLGYSRSGSAHFSMLLSIPTIVAAGGLAGLDIYQAGDSLLRTDAVIAAALAFVTALLSISMLMRWLERSSFTPFAVYRVVLGVALLWWAYA